MSFLNLEGSMILWNLDRKINYFDVFKGYIYEIALLCEKVHRQHSHTKLVVDGKRHSISMPL